jgi:hypothetical protein
MTAEVVAALLASDGPVRCSVLDIAAGHGLYGITLARHNPDVRDIAIDWAPVLEVAKQNAREAEVSDRFTPRSGSAFDVDWGTGHAVVLLTNFLHHFTRDLRDAARRTPRRAGSRRPRGRRRVVPDESRVSPGGRGVQPDDTGCRRRRRRLHLAEYSACLGRRVLRPSLHQPRPRCSGAGNCLKASA